MADERHTISRREFTALTVAAGVSAATGVTAAPVTEAVDTDVSVKTPSGTCDAALVHPQGSGHWPAIILFPDAFGLRPTMRAMAKRLAMDGYTVLVPNPYYRSTKAPGIGPDFDFGNPTDRAKLAELRAPLTSDAVMQDAAAYVAFLDSHAGVNVRAKMGVVGYCMGGPMTMQAAAANPGRIGAGASFHGGGLVTDKPDSPHLLVPKIKAQFYIGIAANDDEKQPDAKTKLDESFHAAKGSAKIEVYPGTLHGWCVRDMPLQAGNPIYNEPQAERAWNELVTLYKRALV
ncbi:MAG TPA: dienelactone hydrolase family protein [Steroidobacteraceae bacterium]|nr:dienelactone hydrolase family protein [Steroidobacteraceae bacterium]